MDDLKARRRRAFRMRLAELGISGSEAATLAGLSKSYFSQIQNGVYACSDKCAQRVAEVLQKERSELFI